MVEHVGQALAVVAMGPQALAVVVAVGPQAYWPFLEAEAVVEFQCRQRSYPTICY